jgi:hypothetical protein
MDSIDSIDTVYRSNSKDIIVFNPILTQDRNTTLIRDIENNLLTTSILVDKDKNQNKIPIYYYIVAVLIIGFFITVIIIIVLDLYHIC